MKRKRTQSLIATLAASLALAACGGGTGGDPPGIDVVAGDCSSFREELRAFVPDMVAAAVDAAEKRRRLLAACFDGAPLRTLAWYPDVDFAERKRGVDEALMDKVNLGRAMGLRRQFERMIESTPTRVRGSGQLELLELLSQTPDLRRAHVFTDAIVNQVDGIDLATASRQDIERLVRRWVPRMDDGLRGVSIVFVGVGRGTNRTADLRKAEVLFRGIVEGAGGTFTWAPNLPRVS